MKRWCGGWVFIAMLSLAASLSSCRREDPSLPPSIQYILPAENRVFMVGDTIEVMADIQSGLPLEKLTLSLRSKDDLPIQHTVDLIENLQGNRIHVFYPLYDTTLSSATYSLLIHAIHATESKKQYREINVEGLPRVWLGVIALIRQAFDRTRVVHVRPDLSTNVLDTLQGDYLSSVMLHPSGILVQAGKITGGLQALHLGSGTIKWSVPPSPNPPFPTFSGLDAWGGMVFAGLYEGRVRVFQAGGHEAFGVNIYDSRIPQRIMLQHDRLVVDEQVRNGSTRYLGVYYYPSGLLSHMISPGMETIGLFPSTGQTFFWVGNLDGQGVLRISQINMAGFYSPLSLPSGKVKAACAGPVGHVFIAMEQGLLWYRKDYNSLTTLQANVKPHDIKFEEVHDKILAACGNNLCIIAFPGGQVEATVPLQDSIFHIHPYYSR